MADLKISQLTSATLPLAGTEVLPIVQSSSTKKVATDDLTVKNVRSNATTGILQIAGPSAAATRTMTVPDANFTAARIDAAQSFTGDQTLGTGNLIQGTAAKGVNFTANTPAAGMTSQLLNWYEEGTWTPTVRFGGGATGITYSRQNGRYTRVGKLVTVTWDVRLSNKGSSTGAFTLAGLPFSAEGAGGGYSTSQFYFYSGFTTIKKMGTSYTNGGTTLDEVVDSADVAVSDTHFTNTSILFGSLTYLAA